MSHDLPPEIYEEKDWEWRPIKWAVVSTFAFLALGIVLGALTVKIVKKHRAYIDEPTLFPMQTLPPTPRLQADEPGDNLFFKAQEKQLLSTYGWIDPQQGTVRLPIERAMELTARDLGGQGR